MRADLAELGASVEFSLAATQAPLESAHVRHRRT